MHDWRDNIGYLGMAACILLGLWIFANFLWDKDACLEETNDQLAFEFCMTKRGW